jgi:hypothetical protein
MTYVLQLEITVEKESAIQPAIKRTLDLMVTNLSGLQTPGDAPPFQLNLVSLGLRKEGGE